MPTAPVASRAKVEKAHERSPLQVQPDISGFPRASGFSLLRDLAGGAAGHQRHRAGQARGREMS